MNKTDVIEHVAQETGLSKAATNRTLQAFIDTVIRCLKRSEKVSFIGFGSFGVRSRKARMGHIPKSKIPVQIKAANIPVFRPGKALKRSMNSHR